MRQPDFFIVGAPKCGTTALFQYLAEHHRIFTPRLKEPHFFATDLRQYTWCTDETEYIELFGSVGTEHDVVGEASVWYLYSKVAAQRIRATVPNARLIVMVREPTAMFLSLHNQMLARFWEDEEDAERAWRLQEDRIEGRNIPSLCEDPLLLQYGAICRLGEQLERLLTVFPKEQVHVILFDDFTANTQEAYRHTLEFLGMPYDGRANFPPANVAHRARAEWIARLQLRLDRVIRTSSHRAAIWRVLRPLAPLSRWLRTSNVRRTAKSVVAPTFLEELRSYFESDVRRLETLLGRDLSRWSKPR